MATLTEGAILTDLIGYEEVEYKYSRDLATLISGQNLAQGAVLGKITIGAATVTAKVGNTGTGALTMDATTPILANAKIGRYTARCITAASNAGTFRVFDPTGRSLGDCTVAGAAFANQLKFAIADATDFIVGDEIYIDIAAGSGKMTALAPAATDGSQYAWGILVFPVNAASADQPCVVLRRSAIVKASGVVWPAGISATAKADAISALEQVGVIFRTDY